VAEDKFLFGMAECEGKLGCVLEIGQMDREISEEKRKKRIKKQIF